MKKLLFLISFAAPIVAFQEPNFNDDCAQLKKEWNLRFSQLQRGLHLLSYSIKSNEVRRLESARECAERWKSELYTFIHEQSKEKCARVFAEGLIAMFNAKIKKIDQKLAIHAQLAK